MSLISCEFKLQEGELTVSGFLTDAPGSIGGEDEGLVFTGMLSFEEVSVNDNDVKSLTVKNNGGFSLTINNFSKISSSPSPFVILSTGSCSVGESLDPGESCTLDVQFTPTSEGSFSTSFQVGYTTGGRVTSWIFEVSGLGIETTIFRQLKEELERVSTVMISQEDFSIGTGPTWWVTEDISDKSSGGGHVSPMEWLSDSLDVAALDGSQRISFLGRVDETVDILCLIFNLVGNFDSNGSPISGSYSVTIGESEQVLALNRCNFDITGYVDFTVGFEIFDIEGADNYDKKLIIYGGEPVETFIFKHTDSYLRFARTEINYQENVYRFLIEYDLSTPALGILKGEMISTPLDESLVLESPSSNIASFSKIYSESNLLGDDDLLIGELYYSEGSNGNQVGYYLKSNLDLEDKQYNLTFFSPGTGGGGIIHDSCVNGSGAILADGDHCPGAGVILSEVSFPDFNEVKDDFWEAGLSSYNGADFYVLDTGLDFSFSGSGDFKNVSSSFYTTPAPLVKHFGSGVDSKAEGGGNLIDTPSFFYGVKALEDHSLIVSGGAGSGFIEDNFFGSTNAVAMHLDGSGEIIWSRQFHTTSSFEPIPGINSGVQAASYFGDIDKDENNNLYFSGYIIPLDVFSGSGGTDVLLHSTDIDGINRWTISTGTSSNDFCYAIKYYDGFVYCAGITYGDFDGVNAGIVFKNYNDGSGLADNQVNDIFSYDNNIFVATDSGLSYSSTYGSSFEIKGSGTKVNTVFYDDANNIVIAGTDSEFWFSNDGGDSFTANRDIDGDLIADNVAINDTYIFDGSGPEYTVAGYFLFAATGSGLSVTDDNGTTFYHYDMGSGIGANNINSVFVRDDGYVFLATDNGLSVSNGSGLPDTAVFQNYIYPESGDPKINDVHGDSNNLFLATGSGLLEFGTDYTSGPQRQYISALNGLPSNEIKKVLYINSHIFVGTDDGLFSVEDNGFGFPAFVQFSERSIGTTNISSNIINSLSINNGSSNYGDLFVGTDSGFSLLTGGSKLRSDFFLLKADSNTGNIEYVNQLNKDFTDVIGIPYAGFYDEEVYSLEIFNDAIYLAGRTNSNLFELNGSGSGLSSDGVVFKYDLEGNLDTSFGSGGGIQFGATTSMGSGLSSNNSFSEIFYDLAIDSEGNIVLAGETDGNTLEDNGSIGSPNEDVLIMKMNGSGEIIWSKQYGDTTAFAGSGGGDNSNQEMCSRVLVDWRNNIYCAGLTSGSFIESYAGGGSDIFAFKLDSDGNEIWATQFGSGPTGSGIGVDASNSEGEGAIYGLDLDFYGNLYIPSMTRGSFFNPVNSPSGGDALLIRLDREGKVDE